MAGPAAGLPPGLALLGALVCFLAGIVGGVSGFGAGLIVTVFITPIVGPQAVVPVISVLMLINNGGRAWFLRAHLAPERILPIAGFAVPFAALGALLYVRLDAAAIQTILGAILVASPPFRRWMENRRMRPSPPVVAGVSAAYGFLSSLVVGAGMLAIPLLLGFGLTGPALIATDAAIAVLVNVSKIAFFGALDALPLPLLLLAVGMGLCTIPGAWAAAWILKRASIRLHTAVVEALIVFGGLRMLWLGLTAS